MQTKTTITLPDAVELIKSQQGIFTVEFIKKDGSLRKMNCRFGVRKYFRTPNGSGRVYNPAKYGLITVYDLKVGGYRSINLSTVQSVTCDNVRYEVQ